MGASTIESLVPMGRIELPTSPYQGSALPLSYMGLNCINLERVKGIEPSS